jgi:catechol 2,3-dioxygenase-like lactoylglutathione lyase family enzyme
MDDVLARLMSRRKLLQALGITAVGTPLAAALGTSAFAQGGCRDGYGQGRCTLTKEVATAPIKPVFDPTGWKTIGLDHLTFEVADYKKEAAFYTALMGWKLRSDDGKQAVMDMGDWGSCIFKTAAAGRFDNVAPPAPRGGNAAGGRGGNRAPLRAEVTGQAWVIDPWDAKKVEAELKKRGITATAENGPGGFESFQFKDPDGYNIQICNSNGLYKARKTPSTAKLSEPLPFESTGWKTIWLDHLSWGASDYKRSVSYFQNLLGWVGSYDEGTQNEVMIGDVGDAIIRGGNANDPNFGRGGRGGAGDVQARATRIDHISFGISPWDVDGVREALERRELTVSVDTSSAHMGPDGKMVSDDIHQAAFQSYHTTTPNGYNLQISWMSRDKRLALANAVKPKALLKQ